jgi:hypothetical protein
LFLSHFTNWFSESLWLESQPATTTQNTSPLNVRLPSWLQATGLN